MLPLLLPNDDVNEILDATKDDVAESKREGEEKLFAMMGRDSERDRFADVDVSMP